MSKPVKNFRSGGVDVAKWDNEGRTSYSVQKNYKDKEGNWKQTTSFNAWDLPHLIAAFSAASVGEIGKDDKESSNQESKKIDDAFESAGF